MSTIAILALFLACLLVPANPLTWVLAIITFGVLAVETVQLVRDWKKA